MFSSISSNVTSWLGGTQPDDDTTEEVKISPDKESAQSVDVKSAETKDPSNAKNGEEKAEPEGKQEDSNQADAAEPALQEQLDEVGAMAVNTAKEWGTWLYGVGKVATKEIVKTAKVVKDTVEEKTILGEFSKEQDKFVSENTEKKKKSEVGVAPWIGYNEEEEMKKQILALSQDQRNFLRNPPAGVQFQFEYSNMFPVALAVLQEDTNLEKMRFQLVPKSVKEEDFWRNYFYRVSLIKQSAQLTSLAQSTGSTGEGSEKSKSTESLRDVSTEEKVSSKSQRKSESEADLAVAGSPPENEFISDAFQSDQLEDDEALKKEMQQLGVNEEDGGDAGEDIPEWEKELQAELQEYEVVDDENALDDADLEKEILQQLEQEQASS